MLIWSMKILHLCACPLVFRSSIRAEAAEREESTAASPARAGEGSEGDHRATQAADAIGEGRERPGEAGSLPNVTAVDLISAHNNSH